VLERQVFQLVLRTRRVDQVAGEHRVDVEPAERHAMLCEHDGVELQIVAGFLHRLVLEDRPQHLEGRLDRQAGRFAERAVSGGHVVPIAGRCRERQANNRRAHCRRPIGQDTQRKLPGGPEPVGQLQHVVDGIGYSIGLGNRAGGRRVLLDEQPETELVEDLEAPLARPTPVPQRLGIELHRHVRPDPRQFAALPSRFGVGEQAFAITLVLHLRRVGEKVLERSVLRNQLLRTLLADAGNALDVVDGVAHQRQDVDDELGRHAELLLHALGVVPGSLFLRIPDADAVAHELKEVLVAGHDRNLEAGRGGFLGQRPDYIVRLESLGGENRHAERLAGSVHHRDLFGELVGHRRATRFVVRDEIVAEGAAGQIERSGDVFRLVLAEQLSEHRHEDVHGVGWPSLRIPEEPAFRGADGRVERAVHLRAAVDQIEHQLFTITLTVHAHWREATTIERRARGARRENCSRRVLRALRSIVRVVRHEHLPAVRVRGGHVPVARRFRYADDQRVDSRAERAARHVVRFKSKRAHGS
jgi:hypothetical protein